MQHVKLRWLRIFNFTLVGVTALLFLTYVLFNLLDVSQSTKNHWGITPDVLFIGAVHAIYVVLTDRLFIKRYAWLVTLISMALYAFLFGAIIEASGNTNLVYRLGYVVFAFFLALDGVFPPAAAVIFTWMILIFTVTGIATPTNASLGFNIVIDTLLTASAYGGWLFFKKHYVSSGKEVVLETKLEEEQFKTSTILESITDGVLVIALNGIIQIANQSAAEMLGWTKDEIINLDYHSLIKPVKESSDQSDTETEAITAALANSKVTQQISKLETLHGRQIFVDIVASPIFETVLTKEGQKEQRLTAVIAVLRDVDKQKRTEQQRSDFISTASHEMRTPVASIQGYLELALNPKISHLDEKTKGFLDKAYDATKHLGQLFQDLLTVSQTEDGRLSSHPTIVDIKELLLSMCDGFKQSASKKGLTIVCNLHPEQSGEKVVTPPMNVKADTERLREVIANLIENAIKYTPSGNVTVNAEVKESEDSVVISVADTGPGIAEEDIPHLFQKFYRVDNTATREIGGTGLGLYISKQIVELFDGKIWVESKVGEGSTFFISLPRINPDAPDAPLTKPLEPPTQALS